ncbi:Undecaprenyl-phosphate 4-deoxy-4-formamido-L-arabinose transferase [Novipirellula aureliae]|uniref:Undecaprenyl-phosphate 4-deoxy-4-formamido-L-arabinose transferase n=1 Tax=Novipirellula aureliae TaxID=2527966 RepID=A0A5C6E3F8_9BACT|nr:glycosyltransferase family 2 protein [Novipirellula aureliae]TWU43225.1 Undecaprenyl-phosphate 4-deoxy-4-formamido-L-arabinose transferase [Novipirellula aureliae]
MPKPTIDLSVVIPLYNEEESVGPLLSAVRDAFVDQSLIYELVLVDDGSTDQTYTAAIQASESTEMSVRIVSLQRNFGQTAAMQAGIDAANGSLIATLDGDLQNDPADIPKMVEHLKSNGLDLLVGRRKKRQDGLFLRLIPSWIANRLIAKVTGVRIHDYGCSLKIYRASVIKQVNLMGEMHRFIPAWVAAVTHPSRIGEIDVNHKAREFGTSKYGISRTIRVVLDLLSVLFFMRYRARPGHFFGSVGLVVGAIGSVMLGTVFVEKFVFGHDIGSRPMLLMGAVAMLSSLQLICFGVMAEMIARLSNQSNRQDSYFVRHQYSSDTSHSKPGSSVSTEYVIPITIASDHPANDRKAG